MPEDDQAFVTLATNDAYTMGSLVVGKCLRRHGTTRKLVVMVSASVSTKARSSLEEVFDEVMLVDVLDSRDKTNLSWLDRPDLGVTFTKLHCWTLTHYTKCVFLDADILVLCNIDELFEREELSASPDAGWPDCFNSGVFVFRPSLDTHSQLMEHARLHGSFDGGDQGLLNSFFSDWAVKDLTKHLPFVYNLSANALYTYFPAFQKFGHQAKIVHFLGETKPWHLPYNQQLSGEVPASDSQTFDHYVKMWWTEYYSQTDQHRQQSLAKPQTFALPQCQETGWEAQSREETFPSLSLSDLTLKTNGSSSCQQPNERISDTEFVSVSDSTDLKSLESQEDPFDRDEEETGTESDHSTPLSSKDGSDTTEVDSEDDSEDDRLRWEEGRVDYLGKDAFDNIKKQLDRFLD